MPGFRIIELQGELVPQALNVEKRPGSYVLLLHSSRSLTAAIGKRMSLPLRRGYYAYCGSAKGPGGLATRLGHHTRPVRRRHWHIDYLRDYAQVVEIWYSHADWLSECRWAQLLKSIGELYIPIKGFGASDCACGSHLMYSSTKPDVEVFKQIVMNQTNDPTQIHRIKLELGANANG